MILGVLGGSGLYDFDGLTEARSSEVSTPYGAPSGPLLGGRIGDARVLFLPRHGAGHRFSPSEINYRANVCALKLAGATQVLSISAVGSLREGMPPGDLVLCDQFIDKTYRRASTFFDAGAVGHVSFAEPTCPAFSAAVAAAAIETGFVEAPATARLAEQPRGSRKRLHRGATYVCMEGPQFSTRAESLLHRSWGADLIGMTAVTEAKLCREAEVCFAALALVTDYDCWHAEEAAVTAAAVVAVLAANVAGAKEIVRRLPQHAAFSADCGCSQAAAHALLTAPGAITPEARQRLRALHGRENLNMSSSASPLLVVGSVGLDTVETRAGKRADVLGGAASYFSVAASFLAPVRLTGIVGTDFPDAHTQLFGAHAVDLAGLERVAGKTFRWSGVYAPDFSTRTTLDTQLNVFSDFRPKLPAAWTDSPYVFLANIDPVLQLSVLEQTGKAGKKPKFVACDTMNFWIEGKRADLLKLLERVDMLLLNDEEARQLSGEANLPAAARAIRALGPRAVVIKRGDAGALLFHEGGVFAAPAFPIENVVDPTGAGDSFGGGFMGWIAREGDTSPATIRTAMIMGSVLASFSVEDFSLDRFKRLDLGQIRERFAAFADLVHFEKIKL